MNQAIRSLTNDASNIDALTNAMVIIAPRTLTSITSVRAERTLLDRLHDSTLHFYFNYLAPSEVAIAITIAVTMPIAVTVTIAIAIAVDHSIKN